MKPIYVSVSLEKVRKEENKGTLLATSKASWSGVKRTYAFFFPSGLKAKIMSKKIMAVVNRAGVPDQSVDLCSLDIVQLFHSVFDLTLVGLDVNDEHQCVVFFNLFHGWFRVQRPRWNRRSGFSGHEMQKRQKTHETIVLNWSILGTWLTLFLGYLGSRGSRRVLGRWKETEKRCLREEWEWAPWRAAFLAALALASLGAGKEG